jgi:regulator of replication initiation timing
MAILNDEQLAWLNEARARWDMDRLPDGGGMFFEIIESLSAKLRAAHEEANRLREHMKIYIDENQELRAQLERKEAALDEVWCKVMDLQKARIRDEEARKGDK